MKGILRNLHRYVLWALVSVVFWAWVFTRVLDAPAGKKLVVYADMPDLDRAALSAPRASASWTPWPSWTRCSPPAT